MRLSTKLKAVALVSLFLGWSAVVSYRSWHLQDVNTEDKVVDEYKIRSIDEVLTASAKNEISGIDAITESNRIKNLENKDANKEIKNSEHEDLKAILKSNDKSKLAANIVFWSGAALMVGGLALDFGVDIKREHDSFF